MITLIIYIVKQGIDVQQGAVHILESDFITVGRGKRCMIEVINPYVSNVHCSLFKYPTANDYEIMDGGWVGDVSDIKHKPSNAGTWLNGIRLEGINKYPLKHGDVIELLPSVVKMVYEHPLTDTFEIEDTAIMERTQIMS